jgi:hypothetical protein
LKRKTTHCSNCSGTYYNIHRCPNALAVNSQQQHAWEFSSLDTSSSNNDSSDDDDNKSLNTKDLEWMAELERYNKIQARAHEIIERQYQEAIEDNDIEVDSDGRDEMEGIRIGSDG